MEDVADLTLAALECREQWALSAPPRLTPASPLGLGGRACTLTEWGPSMTLTMSFTWMLFCSESRDSAKRLSFLRVTAWCLTVTTFPYMFSTYRGAGGEEGQLLGHPSHTGWL